MPTWRSISNMLLFQETSHKKKQKTQNDLKVYNMEIVTYQSLNKLNTSSREYLSEERRIAWAKENSLKHVKII